MTEIIRDLFWRCKSTVNQVIQSVYVHAREIDLLSQTRSKSTEPYIFRHARFPAEYDGSHDLAAFVCEHKSKQQLLLMQLAHGSYRLLGTLLRSLSEYL